MLNAHGLSDEEIERQLATLSSNTADSTGVLTTYSLLHSLHHLDAIDERSASLPLAGDAVVALFRCSEICLHVMGVLADRVAANLAAGDLDRAVSNTRWRSGYHGVLYELSALIVDVGADPSPGRLLDIRESAVYRAYRRASDDLHGGLMSDWSEDDAAVFDRGLDDPLRFVFFSEFANTSDERIWLARLSRVRVPGADLAVDYETLICSGEIVAMMEALETEAETDLLPFRAVHQVAELLASLINRRLCDVVASLANGGPTREDTLALAVSNRLLGVVDSVIQLMLRALTPHAYRDVRSNLGMVRGTSSIVLRMTLFNQTYPLLVRAFRLRLCDYDAELAADDEAVEERAGRVLETADGDFLREVLVLHQHIRTWRDNHQQFPKTHLGVSAVPGQPTVSLSGSDSAVDIAHSLRGTHATDPVAPLYRAALGTDHPAVHELLSPDGFDEYMAHKTARAVFDVYAEVQTRFEERVRRRADTRA